MKVQSQYSNPVQISEVDQAESSEIKNETSTEPTESSGSKQSSAAEANAKKAEMKMAGQAQAVAIQWRLDEGGGMWSVQRRGCSGAPVKELQEKLNKYRAGKGLPPLLVDGKYGKDTEAAVREFQEHAHGKGKLKSVDGVAGPETESLLGVSRRYRIGNEGESIQHLQENLNIIRKAAGEDPISEDGSYKKETEEAVRDYQKNMELKSDGVVGPETQESLAKAAGDIQTRKKVYDEAKQEAEAQMDRARAAEREAKAADDMLKALG